MYLQQMLCVIAPCRDMRAGRTLSNVRPALDAALKSLAYVHFASFALLPPPRIGEAPSLMLELAVDDGIDPARSLGDVIDATAAQLWPLYLGTPGQSLPPRDTMRQHLRELLWPLLSHARPAGGFIGMRDRTVAQIESEKRYFHTARAHMIRIRDQARAKPAPVPAAALVDDLLASLSGDPAHVAMQSPPPRSFWCEPRSPVLQLLIAMVWAVLPVPMLLCATGSLGLLADALTPRLLPVDSGLFGLGLVAGVGLLATITLVWVLMRKGGISMLVFFVLISTAGILAFYAVLAADYVIVASRELPPGRLLPELSWPQVALAIGALLLLWTGAQSLGNRVMQAAMAVTALAGAAAMIVMLAAVALGTTRWSGYSWRVLYYVVPGLLAAAVIWYSVIARWVLSLGLVLILVLVPLLQNVPTWIPPGRLNDYLNVGLFQSELIYVGLGLLAVAGAPLLVAIVGTLLGLLGLRPPLGPVGVPLLLLLTGLVALAILLGWLGDWQFHRLHPALDAFKPHAPSGVICAIALLVAAGAVFWGLGGLSARFIPDILRYENALDLPGPMTKADFVPWQLHRTIVANEASLTGGPSHMISVTDFRGWGAWMWRVAWVFLHVVGQIGHSWFTKGLLAEASGIKFAHWHIIDRGRRLLFVSNFDGDFAGYLDQFILGPSEGINLIWRWTRLDKRPATLPGQPAVPLARSFPDTRNLSFLGCRLEQRFKAYAHASMVPHLYLYQAYRLSNDDIQRATLLRTSLLGERTIEKDDLILRILES